MLAHGCVRQYRCFENKECKPKICEQGECVYKCSDDRPCNPGFRCVEHECAPLQVERPRNRETEITCPEEMVLMADLFCIDRYEASRPDATEITAGSDDSKALSVEGVMPWQAPTNAIAEAACAASGKRLCSPTEWEYACRGPDETDYAYGDGYDPVACNGIDTFEPGGYHLLPTGSFDRCTNAWGVFDMNGNLWERVAGGDDTTVRGGAFNCKDSKEYHRCDYVPNTWSPSALGFRCCLDPEVTEVLSDGGVPDENDK